MQQMVRQGLKEKAGISQIVARIESGITGVYRARGYSEGDHDVALLVLRLGGRRLLYALNHRIGIPSLRALRRKAAFTKLMPSLGAPTIEDITYNIKSIFSTYFGTCTPAWIGSGWRVMWDEVFGEGTACYFKHCDCAGGFCREHSAGVNTRLSTFESAVEVAHRLAQGKLHYGKEISVIAMGSRSDTFQGAFPILLSPTCKAETPDESASLLKRVLYSWDTTGAPSLGAIWSFASDGDAGRRAMVYKMFMKNTVDDKHPLYPILGRLPGLNLQVGDGDITADFDWKHELKRESHVLAGFVDCSRS